VVNLTLAILAGLYEAAQVALREQVSFVTLAVVPEDSSMQALEVSFQELPTSSRPDTVP
jgi:hypothetical protein